MGLESFSSTSSRRAGEWLEGSTKLAGCIDEELLELLLEDAEEVEAGEEENMLLQWWLGGVIGGRRGEAWQGIYNLTGNGKG